MGTNEKYLEKMVAAMTPASPRERITVYTPFEFRGQQMPPGDYQLYKIERDGEIKVRLDRVR